MNQSKKYTEFIKKCKEIYNDRFDYDAVNYKDSRTNIEIKCKEHGSFSVTPSNFLRGKGCPYCNHPFKFYTASKERMIENFVKIHGDKYDYTFTEIPKSPNSLIKITCKKHGTFNMRYASHAKGANCPECMTEINANKTISQGRNTFFKNVKINHGNLYDYSQTNYSGMLEPVTVICKIHGEFTQQANYHMNGGGCPHCYGNYPTERSSFIKNMNLLHEGKYNYNLIPERIRNNDKIPIICKVHGKFTQKVSHHKSGHGCKKCADINKTHSVASWDKSYAAEPTLLYFVKMVEKESGYIFYKFGVTKNNIDIRFKDYRKYFEVHEITKLCANGKIIHDMEHQLHNMCKDKSLLYKERVLLKYKLGGWTECIKQENFLDLESFLQELINR